MAPKSPAERLDELAGNRTATLAFRDTLRDARSEVLADAEGFMVVVAAIERVGKWVTPSGNSFSRYERGLQLLVERAGVHDTAAFAGDLCVLRESRNDTAHGGAAARHATDEALRVGMVLEEALTVLNVQWKDVTAEHVMTRNPFVAEPWQLVADVRRVMLTRGFTALPYRAGEGEPWSLITDEALAAWLNPTGSEGRKARQNQTVEKALGSGLNLAKPAMVAPDDVVGVVAGKRGLRLVTKGRRRKGNLLGVIAPADLL